MGLLSLIRIPTGTAWLLFVVGLGAFFGARASGWVELMIIATACVVALVLALPFVIGKGALDLQRTINPIRVQVDEQALAEMRTTNTGSRRSGAISIEERIAGSVTVIDVPPLAAGRSAEFLYSLPTERRGVFQIGPATVLRGDPIGLFRRPMSETGVDTLWVHPRAIPTKALAAGFAKDLEGPTFDTSPAGDVAFHAIREYQPGDDVRHIHWMTTARKGQLMVRHYVDNRRPFITVVIDDSLSGDRAPAFETGVEIAASIGRSAILRETPSSIRVGTQEVLGVSDLASVETLLDRLSAATAKPEADASESLGAAMTEAAATSVLVFVTAGRSADELLIMLDPFMRQARLVVVNIGAAAEALALPRVTCLNVQTLDEFGLAWDQLT